MFLTHTQRHKISLLRFKQREREGFVENSSHMIIHNCAGNAQGCFIFSGLGQAMGLWGWVQVGLGGNGEKGSMGWWSANHSKQTPQHSLKTGQNCLHPHPFPLKLNSHHKIQCHTTQAVGKQWSNKCPNNRKELTGPLLYGIFNSFFIFSASETTSTSPTQSGNMWAIRKLKIAWDIKVTQSVQGYLTQKLWSNISTTFTNFISMQEYSLLDLADTIHYKFWYKLFTSFHLRASIYTAILAGIN